MELFRNSIDIGVQVQAPVNQICREISEVIAPKSTIAFFGTNCSANIFDINKFIFQGSVNIIDGDTRASQIYCPVLVKTHRCAHTQTMDSTTHILKI
jgi:hypothetical protein